MGSSSGWWGLSCPAHCRSCFSLLRPASLGFPLGLSFARFACRSLLSLPAPRDTAAGDWELVEDVAAGHSTLDPVDPSNGSKPGRARPGVPSSSSSILPSECLPLLFLGPAARHSQSRERRPGGGESNCESPTPETSIRSRRLHCPADGVLARTSLLPEFWWLCHGFPTESAARVYCKAAQVEFPAHL